jgi:hypothetical protein
MFKEDGNVDDDSLVGCSEVSIVGGVMKSGGLPFHWFSGVRDDMYELDVDE